MTETCSVCCEQTNKTTRSLVKCPYCPFVVCSSCSERYLCETSEDAHCMSCRRAWSREILVDNFTQKFVTKTYKTRRENLLFEREKSMMPATQPYVEMTLKIKDLNKKIIKIKIDTEKAQEKASAIRMSPIEGNFDSIVERQRLYMEQTKIISSLSIDFRYAEWHQHQLIHRLHGGMVDNERRQFVRACPYDGCRGFLSTAWKCGVCENWTCPECHEGKGKDRDGPHECSPENLATAKLLNQDSRNCPNCAVAIFKINGCDQMYCTQCHTAFSWKSGRIETGPIHNPHYYEYMRAHGGLQRNPGDVPCGGFPDVRQVRQILINEPPEIATYIFAAHRSYGHCQWIITGRYIIDNRNDNRDLRIQYMINDIDEETFKKKIQQREKARQRKSDILQVLQMFMAVLVDLFQAFMQDRKVEAIVNSLRELRNHVNATLTDVSKRYGNCAVPYISLSYDI